MQQHLDSCGAEVGALHYSVLRQLEYESHTLSELAKQMALEPATLVPVIDELERQELAMRSHDPADRRRTPLLLTDRGRQLLACVPAVPTEGVFVLAVEKMGDRSGELLQLLRELTRNVTGDKSLVERIGESFHQHAVAAPNKLKTTREPFKRRD